MKNNFLKVSAKKIYTINKNDLMIPFFIKEIKKKNNKTT